VEIIKILTLYRIKDKLLRVITNNTSNNRTLKYKLEKSLA